MLKEANASALVVNTREELAGLSDAEITAAAKSTPTVAATAAA